MAILTQGEYDSVEALGEDQIFVLRQISLGFPLPAIGKQLSQKADRDTTDPLDKVIDSILDKFELKSLSTRERQLHAAAKRYVDYSDMNKHNVEPEPNTPRKAAKDGNGSAVPQRLGPTSVWASLPPGEWHEVLIRVGKAIAQGKYVSVDPFKVRPMKGQPREYFPAEEQGSLGGSLELTGQIQDAIIRSVPRVDASYMSPLKIDDRIWRVEETLYEVCDGERRWRSILERRMDFRAKLIEIDDVGAYFVSSVANFNRVGHTALEDAKNLQRLLEGEVKFPLEVAAALQGISVSKAKKLLDILKLPPDVQNLMHPGLQAAKGEEPLGKAFGYQIARLAGNPLLHEHARSLAKRTVQRELKLPQVTMEVDRILSTSGAGRDVLGERNQPARRLKMAEKKLTIVMETLRDVKLRLEDLQEEGVLPETAKQLGPDFNQVADTAEALLQLIGVERRKA